MRDFAAWHRFLAERRTMPFAWGSAGNDCAAFAGGALAALTGRDLLSGLRWTDEKSARRVLRMLGGFETALDAHLRRVPPALAARGDIAGVHGPDGLRLMVVEGATLVGPGTMGSERLPRSAMAIAWSATA